MFQAKAAFSGFSVNDLAKAKEFYTKTLGLQLTDEKMGLNFNMPGGSILYIYPKEEHQPATFTVLNFVVNNIDNAVDELANVGVKFEHYENGVKTDEKGIARGLSVGMGPDIAWFKDPAGNIISVLQQE